MKPIYNNDDLDKYRQVNGLLNDEGQRIFCDRINTYLNQKDKDKEIERLNNIIDKLEIDIEIGTGNYTYDTDYNRGLKDAFIYMNDRLQELKGSSKEL